MISGYEMRRQDRYLVVYDGKGFEVIEEWDIQFDDIPLSEITTDFKLTAELKKAFEYAAQYFDVVSCFRRDRIAEKLVADAININQ